MDRWELLVPFLPILAAIFEGASLLGLVVGTRIWISTPQSPAHHAILIWVGRDCRGFLVRDAKWVFLGIWAVQEWRVQAILLDYQLTAIALVGVNIDILIDYCLMLGALRDALTWHSFASCGCVYELPGFVLVAAVVLGVFGWILVQGRNALAFLGWCLLHAFFVLNEVGEVGLG